MSKLLEDQDRLPRDHFQFCPRCDSDQISKPADGPYLRCANCEFTLFFNPSVAVGALMKDKRGKLFFIRRAKDPHRGKLGLPGGFIDYEETAEEACLREVKEEIGIDCEVSRYICSSPNVYRYKEVTYLVLDFFYECLAPDDVNFKIDPGEVDELVFLSPEDLNLDDIAFPSMRFAVSYYLQNFV